MKNQSQVTYKKAKEGEILIFFRGKQVEAIEPSVHPKIAMRMVSLLKRVEGLEGENGR